MARPFASARTEQECWIIVFVNPKLALRPVREAELSILETLTQDPTSTGEFAWFGWFHPRNYRTAWTDNHLLSGDGGVLIVEVDGDAVGFVNWRKASATVASFHWEIGIALLPEVRGRGYGTIAQRQLIEYLFAHTTAHRVEAATEVGNVAEQRALEKAGFRREGVSRGVGWRAGAWRDGVRYAVLRTDLDA